MSETTTDTSVPRPWHGSDSPFEALHDWMIKELDAIKTAANPTIKALEARIAELETTTRSPAPIVSPIEPMPPSPALDPATYSAALHNPAAQAGTSGASDPVAIIENGTVTAVQVTADPPPWPMPENGTIVPPAEPTV